MTSSIYNYVNNAKVWLPMTAACHDPTNVRTLDKSGNNLHYRFGDGIDSTKYPTKNSGQRGYSFDGSSDYLTALANQTNAINTATWAIYYKRTSSLIGFNSLYYHSDTINPNRGILYTDTNHVGFYSGSNVSNVFILNVGIRGQKSLLAGRVTSDGYRRVWFNGFQNANNTGSVVPGTAVTTNPIIGFGGALGYLNGQVFWFGHWEYALTDLQLLDLEARLARQFNDV